MRAAGKKEKLIWGGRPFHVYHDFPVELQLHCVEYANIKKKLQGTDYPYRPPLLYAARHIVTIDGKKHTVSTVAQKMWSRT